MSTIIDLGQVSSIKISSTPPTNFKLLWYDTNIVGGGVRVKFYNTATNTWDLLAANSSIVDHFKGLYPSLASLQTAIPTSLDGDYAVISGGTGVDAKLALWDSTNTDWVIGINSDDIIYFSNNFTGDGLSTSTPIDILIDTLPINGSAKAVQSGAVYTALQGKVDKVTGLGLSQENYTTSEKNKLANLSEHFQGYYSSLSALNTAKPTGLSGDYAYVDTGSGSDAKLYIWDLNDHTWVLSSGSGVIPDATELVSGIVALTTITQALARTDDTRAMTALKSIALILDEKKNVNYQLSPTGVNETSILMENSGQINSVLSSRINNIKLKIGISGTYPVGAQTYPFTYSANDEVFISYNYVDLLNASGVIKFKCRDN